MKCKCIARACAVIFPRIGLEEGTEARSAYERFAIPYSFKPQLSLAEGVIAAFVTFLRVFLGCLLFAVWGTYSLFAWSTIRNPLWRVVAEIPLLLLFVLSFILMLLVTALLVGPYASDFRKPPLGRGEAEKPTTP